MNRLLWKKIGIEIFIIFLLSLTPLLWFREGYVMVGHDHVAPLDPKVFLEGRLSTWNNQFFGHSQALILGTILIHFIDAIPTFLGFSLVATQKIVFVFWFFLIGMSAYELASVIKPQKSLFKLLAVILYQFNFFILQGWWIGEKSKFSAYIAAPLVLSIFLLVESGRLPVVVGMILNSFIFFLFNAAGLYGIPLYGGLMVVLGSFILFSLTHHWFGKNTVVMKRIIALSIGSVILAFAVNAYIYLPAFLRLRSQFDAGISQIGGVSGVISWASEISANTSFLNLMRLQGISEWYDNPEHPYAKAFLTHPGLIAISFIWPIAAFAALYFVRLRSERRLVLYFFLTYVLGLFFAAGTHPPLGFIYQFLVEKVPGFIIFRTPYFKFAPALFLANAFLIALLVENLPVRFKKFIFGFMVILVLGYHYPFFTGNFFQWRENFSTRLSVPLYVYDFGSWLNKNQREGVRVLLIPPNSPDLQYSLYQWGYLSFQALPTLLSNASVVINNDKLNVEERILTMSLYDAILHADIDRVEKLTNLLNISHVLVRLDVDTEVKSAIPLDPEEYLAGLKKTNLVEKVATFGQWEVYLFKGADRKEFYTVNGLNVVDGDLEDIPPSLEYLALYSPFILDKDLQDVESIDLNKAVIVPKCLNCFKKSRPIITFPERNILPGDPLHSLVLLSERLRHKPVDPKSAIYNTLGTTLKRISEINELLFKQRTLTSDTVDRFIELLNGIEKDFHRIEIPAEKAAVALDMAQYLRAERNFLRPNLGKYVVSGSQTVLTGNIFSAIHKLEKLIEPYITDLEQSNTRVYQFSVNEPTTANILVRSDRLVETVESKEKLELRVDEKLNEAVPVGKTPRWISFGSDTFEKGYHIIKLTLPSALELTYSMEPIDTEFSAQNETSCFGATVGGVSSGKIYRSVTTYTNDFSDNLLFFLWEKGREGQRLMNAVRLSAGPFPIKAEYVFDISPGATDMIIAFCAPNLTAERAQKQFDLKLSEAIYPTIVLTSNKSQGATVIPAEVVKSNPASYMVTLPSETVYPTVLVFPERFDPWWELTGAENNHVRVNGYANGWVIDKKPQHSLKVAYLGQKYFQWGIGITAALLFTGAVVLRKKIRAKYP